MDTLERFRGALLGLVIGDALGTTLEFRRPGSFQPLTTLQGGGPFHLSPGQWTDDTSMALCLAESLVQCQGFDPADQMARYLRWYREGYYSSTGICFDIGNTTRRALEHFERDGKPYAGSTDPQTAGNGSLMRLAPVPMFYARQPIQAIEKSGDSSRTTHAAATAVDACRYYGGLLAGALQGTPKDELLASRYAPVAKYWKQHRLHPEIEAVARGSFKRKQPPEIVGSGYVVLALEAALWAFHQSTSFTDGALLAVNLGDDADTTGAIYGQLAGAYYGAADIPGDWLEQLHRRAEIEQLSEQLYHLSAALFVE